MDMPLRPRPAVPVPSGLPAGGSEAPSIASGAPQLVPAVAQPSKVQPAKQTVYNMFTDQACLGHACMHSTCMLLASGLQQAGLVLAWIVLDGWMEGRGGKETNVFC